MTALAIASLVTGLVAFFGVIAATQGATETATYQKVYFFGGMFAAVWGAAFLLGAGQ